ncbi:unnamed protein product, partial [Effrenium voratum]
MQITSAWVVQILESAETNARRFADSGMSFIHALCGSCDSCWHVSAAIHAWQGNAVDSRGTETLHSRYCNSMDQILMTEGCASSKGANNFGVQVIEVSCQTWTAPVVDA